MRRFTKDHNDLRWLFPDPSQDSYEKASEVWFDTYEDLAISLLGTCYGKQETFTGDDMIDAFMKGASEAHSFLSQQITSDKSMEELHKMGMETSNKLKVLMDEILEKLDKHDNV